MKTENKLGVALVKELCPVCLKEMDGPIIMNKVLNERSAEKVEALHGKVIGLAETLCKECEELRTKDGADGVYLIGVDMSKTEDRNNPYRTGKIICVKREALIGVTYNFGYIDNELLP